MADRKFAIKLFTKVLLLLLLPTLPAFAEEYPSRPITLVVPFSAGGPGDAIARLLGSSMSTAPEQPLVIENVVGSGGTLGTNRVATAAPGGYTLLLMHVGQATAPALYAKLPLDPVGDFAPIGLVTDVPMILVARPKGVGRPCAHPGRQDYLWQCGPRLRLTSLRADVHG